ncbi:hypothetical protein BC938DRAFT_480142 [Jimgerdemannia flammicorona]|uniref:Uncharacterized protein n=1 Tax=Jimgerdemannia flammicorona TaxID=994334 RepID=A0A433QJB2_9FUNG|nr:hypothetical protein BC938DRAFT_480142 [Jimgerdemannia flammicorona]
MIRQNNRLGLGSAYLKGKCNFSGEIKSRDIVIKGSVRHTISKGRKGLPQIPRPGPVLGGRLSHERGSAPQRRIIRHFTYSTMKLKSEPPSVYTK